MVRTSKSSLFYLCLVAFMLQLFSSSALADVQVTKIDDLSFGSWGGTGDMEQSDLVCIYNTVDANYKISATSPGGVFRMINGANNLNFEVRFQGSSGGFVQLTHGTPSSFTAANTSSATCSGGTNATLKVTVTESALSAAKAGNYAGSLSLLLEPN